MKLRNYRETKQPDLNIIPMIDIMFFLLVFFMLSTMYMVEQKTIPVNLQDTTGYNLREAYSAGMQPVDVNTITFFLLFSGMLFSTFLVIVANFILSSFTKFSPFSCSPTTLLILLI